MTTNHAAAILASKQAALQSALVNGQRQTVVKNGITSALSKTPLASTPITNSARLQTLPSSVSIIQTPTSTAKPAASAASMASNSASNLTPTPKTNSAPGKKVIDVVDLSDDEDQGTGGQASAANKNSPNGLRLVPANQLRGGNATVMQVKGPPMIGGGSYTISNGALVPQNSQAQIMRVLKHPAPLPNPPRHQLQNASLKAAPPRPTLKISRLNTGESLYISKKNTCFVYRNFYQNF